VAVDVCSIHVGRTNLVGVVHSVFKSRTTCHAVSGNASVMIAAGCWCSERVTLSGIVTRRSSPQLFPMWGELRQHKACSWWSDVYTGSAVWWTNPQAVEPTQLQGTRQSTRDAAGRRSLQLQEISDHRTRYVYLSVCVCVCLYCYVLLLLFIKSYFLPCSFSTNTHVHSVNEGDCIKEDMTWQVVLLCPKIMNAQVENEPNCKHRLD